MRPLGKLIEVDLADGRTNSSELSEELAMRFLGGRGLADWLLYQNLDQKVDPLGPENILIFSSGLLTGTQAPGSSRLHVGARSPQTGLLGCSNIGGNFGASLRFAGFQCLLIRGKAKRPVYLWIHDGRAEILDAGSLWGIETWETDSRLKKELNEKKVEIMTIGPAGENLIPFSSIMHGQHDTAGRTGMGAVMGSKNLKAVVVQGEKGQEAIDPPTMAAVKEYIRHIKNSPHYERYSTYGVPQSLIGCNDLGVLCTRNYRIAQSKEAEEVSGEKLNEYVTRRKSCYRCPVHCKAKVKINQGKFVDREGSRPEFETVLSLGVKCGLNDPKALIYLNDLCNRLGMDTASTGSVIAFAMDLYDRGILTQDDCGGLDLTWGNDEAMEALIRQIVKRDGLGDILSQGVRKAAEIIGRGSEKFAYQVKGLEMPAFDPRGSMGLGFGFAVAMRGADFNNTYPLPESRWSPEMAETEFGTKKAADRFTLEGKDILLRRCMIVCVAIDCLGICKIPALSIIGEFDLKKEAALTIAMTGRALDFEALSLIGERVLNLERLLNLRFGATAADDTLPDIFSEEPVNRGPCNRKKVVGLASRVKSFYRIMGWDDNGVPTDEKLKLLELSS